MDQICFTASESIIGMVGSVVAIASTVVNFVPAPDKIDSAGLRLISRVLHFVALDVVTAKKK